MRHESWTQNGDCKECGDDEAVNVETGVPKRPARVCQRAARAMAIV